MTTTDHLDDLTFGDFYDKEGVRITMRQWMDHKEDPTYTFVARSKVSHFLISTIWIGIDMNFSLNGKVPIIFETLVFDANTTDGDYMKAIDHRRYSDEAQALRGHQQVVEKLKQLPPQEEDNT